MAMRTTPREFVFHSLPPWEGARLNKALLARQPAWVKAATTASRVRRLQEQTGDTIAANMGRYLDPDDDYDEDDFVDDSSEAQSGFMARAFRLGATAAFVGLGARWLASQSDKQKEFLRGFAQEARSGVVSEAGIPTRSALYSGVVWEAYQRGTLAEATEGGDKQVKITWHTSGDAAVCELCDSRDDEEYTEDDLPGFPGEGDFGELCILGATCVQSPGTVLATRRWYSGALIRITTASGRQLSCTPNHAILTPSGWARADTLKVGGYVIGASLTQKMGLPAPDVDDVPASIENVFQTLAETCVVQRVGGISVKLHAQSPSDGEVEIVTSQRKLRYNIFHTPGAEPASQKALTLSDMATSAELSVGDLRKRGLSMASPSPCIMRSARPGQALLSGLAAHQEPLPVGGRPHYSGLAQSQFHFVTGDTQRGSELIDRLPCDIALAEFVQADADIGQGPLPFSGSRASSPDSNVALQQAYPDRVSAHPQLPRKLPFGSPLQVSLDEIIDIEMCEFTGHVYNLRTTTGYYIANGIAIHNCEGGVNCRCYLTYEEVG